MGIQVHRLRPAASLRAVRSQTAAGALTREQRDELDVEHILEAMRRGNERFRSGRPTKHDYRAQVRGTTSDQYPAAIILSCIDARAPAELLLDTGIGDTFNARVAGNVINDDLLGSLEFACAVKGAKLVLVLGHTGCGAIKGAIDGSELGHLTKLLDKIKPAVDATVHRGKRTSKNPAFVDAVAQTNVNLTIATIRRRSSVLAKLEKAGTIGLVGAMYDVAAGRVDFFAGPSATT